MCVTINSTIRSEWGKEKIKLIRMKFIPYLWIKKKKPSEYTLHSCCKASTNNVFIHMHLNVFNIKHFLQLSWPTTCKVTRKLVHFTNSRRIPWPTNKFIYKRDFTIQIFHTMALMQNARGKLFWELSDEANTEEIMDPVHVTRDSALKLCLSYLTICSVWQILTKIVCGALGQWKFFT